MISSIYGVAVFMQMSIDNEGFAQFHVQYKGQPITVKPYEVGGHIVQTLKTTMERNLTFSAPKLSVVSVPAEFNQLQRNYTMRAVNFAGMCSIRLSGTVTPILAI